MGPMRPMGPMRLIGLIGPIWLMALMGCSADSADSDQIVEAQQQEEMWVEVTASAPYFVEASEARRNDLGENIMATRSWIPPTTPIRYYLYDDLYESVYANYSSLDKRTIDVFLTHEANTGDAITEPNPLHGRLRYVPAEPPAVSKWKLVLPNPVKEEDVKQGNYYVYGFIPRDAADNATITGNPTYDEGAVLRIEGLQTVMADACVIIGAKEGPDVNTDNGLQAGDFCFNLKRPEPPATEQANYLYLLFDHLCAALEISMNVHAEYDNLRTIKLKEMRLQTANDEGTTKAKMDVTITLNKNTTGSDPIQSVVYTPPVDGEECDGLMFKSDEGLTLTTTANLFLCHFIPHGIKKLILTSKYDVYDKKGNLVREDCEAQNNIPISVIDRLTEATRGYKYVINITVQPTYLWVMSDPDLDNPKMLVVN